MVLTWNLLEERRIDSVRFRQNAIFVFVKVGKGPAFKLFTSFSVYFVPVYCIKQIDYTSGPFLFLPHFDVICDLLLNRRTTTWMTSKCGKNEKVAHDAIAERATFLFLPHFDVFCDPLLNRRTATWNPIYLKIQLRNITAVLLR